MIATIVATWQIWKTKPCAQVLLEDGRVPILQIETLDHRANSKWSEDKDAPGPWEEQFHY